MADPVGLLLPVINDDDDGGGGATTTLRFPSRTTFVDVRESSNVHVGSVVHVAGPVIVKYYNGHSGAAEGSSSSGAELPFCDRAGDSVLLEAVGATTTRTRPGEDVKYNLAPYDFLPRDELRLITRREWLARPSGPVDSLDAPVRRAIIAHTGTEQCHDRLTCTAHMYYLQSIHVDFRKWSDIGYNFVVGGDGCVYEGRGWDTVGAHTRGNNRDSLGIALIGCFGVAAPPPRQLRALRRLLELCASRGKLEADYELVGASRLIPTDSPGAALLAEIETWPHANATPT